jgi:hypothetical protein
MRVSACNTCQVFITAAMLVALGMSHEGLILDFRMSGQWLCKPSFGHCQENQDLDTYRLQPQGHQGSTGAIACKQSQQLVVCATETAATKRATISNIGSAHQLLLL